MLKKKKKLAWAADKGGGERTLQCHVTLQDTVPPSVGGGVRIREARQERQETLMPARLIAGAAGSFSAKLIKLKLQEIK